MSDGLTGNEPRELPWRKHAELFQRLADTAPSQFEREQRLNDVERFQERAKEQEKQWDRSKKQ